MGTMTIGRCRWRIFFVQKTIGILWSGIPKAEVEAELTEAHCKSIEDAKLKDLKIKNNSFQAIDRSIMETVLNRDIAKNIWDSNIWDSMRQKYQGSTSTRVKHAQLQALRRNFEILHMKEGETVDDIFARTLTIANKMKAHGEKMSETAINENRSMTSKFDYVVCSVEESNELDALTTNKSQSSLLVHEQRMHGHKRGGAGSKGCS